MYTCRSRVIAFFCLPRLPRYALAGTGSYRADSRVATWSVSRIFSARRVITCNFRNGRSFRFPSVFGAARTTTDGATFVRAVVRFLARSGTRVSGRWKWDIRFIEWHREAFGRGMRSRYNIAAKRREGGKEKTTRRKARRGETLIVTNSWHLIALVARDYRHGRMKE